MNKKISYLVGIMGLVAAAAAYAHSNDSPSDVISYKIKSGDTFNKFAQKYLQQPIDVISIQKINQISDINRIAVGTDLRIPRKMLKHTLSKATVMSLSCANPIRMGNSKPLTIGTVLREGATINVPPECHVALLLEDSSVIRLPSGAALKLTTLRKNLIESAPEVRLDLSQGRIEIDVNKLGRTPSIPFEVHTPISVMGVRGTEFRVGYSPDDAVGQVEVLGGVVETKGLSDLHSQPVTKGYGIPVDSTGKALAIEKLLPPPSYAGFTATQGVQPSYVIHLNSVPLAEYYIADSTSTANLSGNRRTENLLAAEIFVPKLNRQAVFYQLTSVSASGLVGNEQYYGFCAPKASAPSKCAVIFDAPLAENSPIIFSLSRTIENTTETLIETKTLQAKNGRFSLQGLPAGLYQWVLSYELPNANTGAMSDTTVRQSGNFELIVFPPAP